MTREQEIKWLFLLNYSLRPEFNFNSENLLMDSY